MQLFWVFLIFIACQTLFGYAHTSPVSGQSHSNSVSRIAMKGHKSEDNNNKDDDGFTLDVRIVGGLPTSILNFPYQVSLQYKGEHICGGAIIRPNVIITAAHCVEKSLEATAFQVRAGSTRHSHGGQLLNVQRILRHDHYSPISYNYDIALLQLEQSLTYSERVRPVQLAETNDNLSAQEMLLISGWGLNSETGYLASLLNYVDVQVIPKEICIQNYKYVLPITADMFCAGYSNGGKDSCQGDSGGPLVANKRGVVTLYGIVSWGVGCAQKNYPGVYANVSVLRAWIDEKLASIKS